MTYLLVGLSFLGVVLVANTLEAKKLAVFFNNYDGIFKITAEKYKFPWYWMKGIALNESMLGQNPRVKSGQASEDGLSYGLMQITLETAKTFMKRDVSPAELNNESFSIDLAGKILDNLNKNFDGNEKKVIMAYNQGTAATMAGKTYATNYYKRYLVWKKKILAQK